MSPPKQVERFLPVCCLTHVVLLQRFRKKTPDVPFIIYYQDTSHFNLAECTLRIRPRQRGD